MGEPRALDFTRPMKSSWFDLAFARGATNLVAVLFKSNKWQAGFTVAKDDSEYSSN